MKAQRVLLALTVLNLVLMALTLAHVRSAAAEGVPPLSRCHQR